MADANIDASGKDLANKRIGPNVACLALMERIKITNIDNIQRQRSLTGSSGPFYLCERFYCLN